MTIENKCMEVRGMKIYPDRIENQKLLRVFRSRIHKGNSFFFRYGDHTDERKSRHSDYSDHREYSDHRDHNDRHNDNHRDRGHEWEHSDGSSRWSGGHNDHCDYDNNHDDSGYSEHKDRG